MRYLRGSISAAVVLLFGAVVMGAATITFSSNTSLNTGGNWGGTLPTTADEALFATIPAVGTTLTTTSANLVLGDLIWNNATNSTISINTTTATNRTITLSAGGGFTEAIAQGGATNDLLLMGTNASTNTLTFSGNTNIGAARLSLVLGASGNFDVKNSGAALDVEVVVAGAFNLTKTGNGTLTLAGTNTFGGSGKTFTLSAGTLNLNSAAALGNAANTFVVGGGTVDNTRGSAMATGNYAQTWNGNFAFTGTNDLNLGTGAVTLGGNRQVTINASTLTIGGAIGDSGNSYSLTKAGNGTLTLAGANTYSGATTVSAGTLKLTGSGSIANSSTITNNGTLDVTGLSGSFTVGASQTYQGSGTLVGNTTINGAFTPGNSPGHSTITGDLTLGSTSTTTLEVGGNTTGGTDYDLVSVSGALTYGGTLNIVSFDLGGGAYNFAQSANLVFFTAGSTSGNFSNVSVGGTSLSYNGSSAWQASGGNGYTYTLTLASGTLNVAATAVPEPATFAAIFGALALAGAMLRRRRLRTA